MQRGRGGDNYARSHVPICWGMCRTRGKFLLGVSLPTRFQPESIAAVDDDGLWFFHRAYATSGKKDAAMERSFLAAATDKL